MRRIPALIVVMVIAGSMAVATRAEALSITVVPGGSQFQQIFGRALGPVSDAVFLDLLNAAGDYWEGRLLDNRSLRIEAGWGSRFQAGALAAETDNGVNPIAFVGFNPRFSWFFDPTPLDNSEYADETVLFDDFGGGALNTAIKFDGATGAALDEFDAFSTALHEIGHALGLGLLFDFQNGNQPITIQSPLPFAGSVLPYKNGHLGGRPDELPFSLMQPFGEENRRLLPSDADILAVAQAGHFTNVVLNDVRPVPEPATSVLMLSGLALLFGRRLR